MDIDNSGERLNALLNREEEPITLAEELLVYVYENAVESIPLQAVLASLPEEFDPQDSEQLTMVLVGYAEGQQDLIEKKQLIGAGANFNKH